MPPSCNGWRPPSRGRCTSTCTTATKRRRSSAPAAGGHAIGEFQAIYYTYFPVERARLYRGPGSEPYFIGLHELTHVISHQTLGKPGTRLLAEGLAVALDGGYGVRPAPERPPGTYLQVTVERWVNENLASLLGPRELFDRQERLDEALFYPQAGAFVRFLLERPGGLEAVKALFTAPEAEFPAAFLRAAGTSLEGVRGEYLAWCASLDPSRAQPGGAQANTRVRSSSNPGSTSRCTRGAGRPSSSRSTSGSP